MKWYQMPLKDVFTALGSDENGLTKTQVQEYREKYGTNSLRAQEKVSAVKIFFIQLKNPLIIILFFGVLLSAYSGHKVDAIAILVIILINVMIGFIQEINMRKSMDALKNMAAPMAQVKRAGVWSEVSADSLVPGDIVKLTTGSKVQADMRIIEANQLLIEEAALTGESEALEKISEAIKEKNLSIADWKNMAFTGTQILAGSGIGIVCEIGMQTQLGKIAQMMQETEEGPTPLQQRIHALSKVLIGAAFIIVAIVIGLGIEQGMSFADMVNVGISLTVAAIPEGLPTVVTIVLTLGAKAMAKNSALVRKLASVETLGSTTVICSDKTGTLTQNKMQVLSTFVAGKYYNISGSGYEPQGEFTDENNKVCKVTENEDFLKFLQISAICSDAQIIKEEDVYSLIGTPTEGALNVVAAKAGIEKQKMMEEGFEVIHTFAFDSARKLMSVVIKTPQNEYFVVVKGAPDIVAKRSDFIYLHGKSHSLDTKTNKYIDEAVETFATRALRTLAIAFKPISKEHLNLTQEEYENGFTFLGVHGIIDPPRAEVIPAVKECHSAGIRTIMITGDHAKTAAAIAKEIGFVQKGYERIVVGSELNDMSDEELQQVVKETAVFARVVPEHKLRIVNALKANAEVTAMTGDGVNDAPALRAADIGVAMGITGTDVAKDSADLILLDDNFTSIVKAVREGRRIYDNIKKFIRQGLTANVSEVSAILFAFLLMGDHPLMTLTPLMILWVNLVSDGIPSLALGVEKGEPGLMQKKPRSPSEDFFAQNLASRIIIRGLILGGITYWLFQFALHKGADVEYAQTLAFMTLVFGQLFHIFDARTFSTLYRRNPLENVYLLYAVAIAAILSLLVVYTPLGHLAFGTESLALKHIIMVIAIAALPTLILSGFKEIFRIKWI
ncbi:cation-translocating P-type ATPase [Sulfurimonas sp.]